MKISILCPSYNHERYVGDYLRSLLAQTEKDWELIIVDDCSTDATVAKIKEFHDPRIRLIRHEWNRGVNAGLADALAQASAPICSFTASDDILEPDYVERVLAAIAANADCGFGCVQLAQIDAAGRKTGKILGRVHSSDKNHLFSRMFVDGDGFVSPGLFAKTDLLRKVFPLPLGVCQQQDQLMIGLLASCAKPVFVDNPLVRYRQCASGMSSLSVATRERLVAETSLIMDEVAALVTTEAELRHHFGHLKMLPADNIPLEDIPFWLGRLVLGSGDPERRHWGLRQVMSAFSNADKQQALRERIGFSFSEYMRLFADVKIGFSHEQQKIFRQRKTIKILAICLVFVSLTLAAVVCAWLMK